MKYDLIPLAVFNYVAEAHIAQSYLKAHDIPTFVFDEHTAYMAWHYTLAMGGIRLMVCRQDYEEAVELLHANPDIDVDVKSYEESHAHQATLWEHIMSVVLLMISGLPLPWHRRRQKNQNKNKT